jgi:hypothetical protein
MSSQTGWPEETTFARRLLASARADAAPHDVTEAWTRFTARVGSLVPDPVSDLGGPRAHVAAFANRAARRAAVKWLLLGALGGGGLTAGLMVERRPPAPERPAVESPAPPAAQAGDTVFPPATSEDRPPAKTVPRAAAHRLARVGGPSRRAVEPSTLAAEVSRIDIARIAIASGDFDGAIRLIERYHDDFPEGALAPDAEVVALEAVVGKNDRAEVGQRARGFLARYPNDPHAARVRWLAQHPDGR